MQTRFLASVLSRVDALEGAPSHVPSAGLDECPEIQDGVDKIIRSLKRYTSTLKLAAEQQQVPA